MRAGARVGVCVCVCICLCALGHGFVCGCVQGYTVLQHIVSYSAILSPSFHSKIVHLF